MSIYMYIILCISLKNSKCLEVACFPTNFYKKHFYFTIYMIDFCHRGGEWPFKNVESRQIYASLGISALKNSVSESRISRNMTVSESRILKVWISESRILKIWISESRILKIWISKSRQWDVQFFIRKLIRYEKLRNLTLPESALTIVM